jgi:hypothetical protein
MDDPGVDGLFEWVQGVAEKRWGRAWSWLIYFGLVASFILVAVWVITRF